MSEENRLTNTSIDAILTEFDSLHAEACKVLFQLPLSIACRVLRDRVNLLLCDAQLQIALQKGQGDDTNHSE